MKQYRFDYAHRLAKLSPLIYQWAKYENLGLFDFDNCIYAPDRAHLIDNHLNWQADSTDRLIIIEQHPFFDSDEKYIQSKNEVLEIAGKYSLKTYFLTADYRYWDNISTNECFYPHWYFEVRRHAIQCNCKEFDWPRNRKYNFSCNNMMSNYRSEKIYNYIECFKRNRKDWIISIYNHLSAQISTVDIRDVGGLKEEQMIIWNEQIKDTIPFYKYDLYNQAPQNAMNVLFPGHVDSYCNLVMENSMEIEVLSEKSFKPFIAQQIPVYLAHAGACEMLTKLGFDLFYDFVDHTQYDTIGQGVIDRWPGTWANRIDKVHVLLDQLYTTNFTDCINDSNTKIRLQKNQDYFYSDAIDLMCIENFNQLLNK